MTVLKDQLAEWAPIPETGEFRELNMETGELIGPTKVERLIARDRRTAITFRPDAMTAEVTDYPGWEAFRTMVLAMVNARQDVSPVDGCVRIGLRYINEIRAPLDSLGWSRWVANGLIGPQQELAAMKLTTQQQQHAVQCEAAYPGDSLTLRYGAAKGAVVHSTAMLQRLKDVAADEDFFLIDLDSAWADPQNGVPVLDYGFTEETIDRLHKPIGSLFESLITADLRLNILRPQDKESSR